MSHASVSWVDSSDSSVVCHSLACIFCATDTESRSVSDESVRAARPDDTDAIRSVADRAWRAAHGDILTAETIDAVLSEWYAPGAVREAIDNERVGYFVAERQDTVVGYISGGRSDNPDAAQLSAIYVDPDHWGNGIGTALIDRFEAFCQRRGYERVRLHVLAENDRAQSFYRTHGYEIVEESETELFGERALEAIYVTDLD